jgi:ADP-ribosylglycohydrolase
MWGAIIGDIIGSTFETENNRTPYFELFRKNARFTDDTVCTAAVADILYKNDWSKNNHENISNQLRLWCCTYLNRGFGSMFYQWIVNGINKPYNSYGNGALMRISPVAKYAIKHKLKKETAIEIAKQITNVTHNHHEAILAVTIYIEILFDLLNNQNKSLDNKKKIIIENLEKYNYPLPKKIIEYRINLNFDLTCETSLLIAIAAILETETFENVFYQVISAGGDSDTYAAIAGAMAEAIYGLDKNYLLKIKPYFHIYDEDILLSLENLYKENL